ncbi:MAG: permease prefix domain 1-containing protein [Treponema sp.]|jgi:hypothetical protein|nr:permease prefix domain 1-containing protein [Treponema sp.]
MNAAELVDSLFEGYEKTKNLADFKEELLGNLNAKIESLVKKGMDEDSAFERASAELGDVSSLADELSLKKRKEVFEEVYMDIRRYMPAGRVAAYVLFGMDLLFGIIVAFITWVSSVQADFFGLLSLTAAFAAFMPFFVAAVGGFTFLGLTQETAQAYPAKKRRAVWYTLAAVLIAFGISVMPVVYFAIPSGAAPAGIAVLPHIGGASHEVVGALGALLAFALPGGGLLAFLVLTEKDRLKPWAQEFRSGVVQREMEMWSNPAAAARFGMFSGAIWIFAAGLFVVLGFVIGFKFSWLVFIFAVAVQLLVQGLMSKPQDGSTKSLQGAKE